jgi:lipopolysaccharide transport system ATP-binding protein
MADPAVIEVKDLSKRYLLSHQQKKGQGLRHVLEDAFKWPWRALTGSSRTAAGPEEFWALRGVSFSIGQGEVTGIIGRNGAGKSTLLKIISRITEPTAGRVTLRGRVASLLEVGTGFHPDLTGRENIFLNGAILGMRRAEIQRKFDEIVAFAEVEKFLDTPVKRYSSGMYVRLAFAVAAHLEPEVLLVDEVLAVGDAQFQKKCLGKMSELSQGRGRTVLFVSHNMAAVRSLCTRAILLENGGIAREAGPEECITAYLRENVSGSGQWKAPVNSQHPLQITHVRLVGDSRPAVAGVEASQGFKVELEYEVRERVSNALVEIWIRSADGTHLMTCGEHDANPALLGTREPGRYVVQVHVPGNLFNTGNYCIRINSGIAHRCSFDHCDTICFDVVETQPHPARENRRGFLLPLLAWRTVQAQPLNASRPKTP